MAKSKEPKEKFNVGAVKATMEANGYAKAKSKPATKVELVMVNAADAEASMTEEPREGKLHAGICAGDVEQSAFLP